jgi:hypothetical protein
MGDGEKKDWSDPELVLDQWYKYEQIAMHFNDLLMRFRTQALAGMAAIGTLAAVLVSAKGISASCLPGFFAVLTFLWIAAWVLDAAYYSLLLKGAVKAIKDFERQTRPEGGRERIRLSTTIDETTTSKWSHRVHVFYGIVTGALCLLTAFTWRSIRLESSAVSTSPIPVTFTVDAYRANVDASTNP